MQLWNEKIDYTNHSPKVAVSKIKESEKKARTFDAFFVLKILSLKYRIWVPVLYFNDIFNSSDKDKSLIIFHPELEPEINCWISQKITRKGKDGEMFHHDAYLCLYERVKTRKNGGFLKDKKGGYTYDKQHCKLIVIKRKTTLKKMI